MKRLNMFDKMLVILDDQDLNLNDAVAFTIFTLGRLSKLPKTGTLDEVKEIAILHQRWHNTCVQILEATRYTPETIPGTDRLRTMSVNVGKAKFHEMIETIEDFTRRWNTAVEKMSDALKEKMEIAHAE